MVSAVVKDTEPVRAVKKENAALSLMMIRLKIEGHVTNMELDAVSMISMEMYKTKFAHVSLRKTNVVLRNYTGEVLLPEGMVKAWVKMNKQKVILPLYIVKGKSPPLFGCEWLRKIKLDCREKKTMRTGHKACEALENVLNCHTQVFSETLGTPKV